MSASAAEARTASQTPPLGIICGGGPLPFVVAEGALRAGRSVVLFGIRGWADARRLHEYPHHWISIGQFGRFRRMARSAGCRELVCIGTLLRPALRDLRLDWTTLRLLPRIYGFFRGGDDHLLTALGRLLEEHGFRLLGAHEVAPEILAPAGVLGDRAPAARDWEDIKRGFAVLDAIGSFDVGQAVVIANGRVLAIEAAEGTDGMLERVAALREVGRAPERAGVGVLVKAPKPQQDRRLDLPSIGPTTVERVRVAGLAGIAVRAREAIIIEPVALAEAARRAGIFVVGVEPEPAERP